MFVSVGFVFLACWAIVVDAEGARVVEQVKLPRRGLARPPLSGSPRDLQLTVGFARNTIGNPIEREPVVIMSGAEIQFADIQRRLEEERTRLSRGRAKNLADVSVIIKADPSTPARTVQRLVQICQDAGFVRFALKSDEIP